MAKLWRPINSVLVHRHFIFSLIQIGAKYVGQEPAKKTKDFTPSMTLILFEEPEALLLPPSTGNSGTEPHDAQRIIQTSR